MNISHSLRKVGAMAGSTLMLGMTLGSAASLADFPEPFVDADGQVQSQIVVGTDGKQADVVGAVNLASALGERAVRTEQRTATGTAAGWTATDGQTLDTRNDRLFFLDGLDAVRDTLTSDQLSALESTTYTDDNGDQTAIDHYLYPGIQQVTFGKPADRDEQDPTLHVTNPGTPSTTDSLYQMQANFEDSINFTDSAVTGTTIELFGTEYEVSEDSTASELILFGATQTLSLSTTGATAGQITVDGTSHTIEIDGVNNDGVIYRVDDGSWQQKGSGDTFTVDGETVRIDNVINRQDDAGSADFKVGSEELHLRDGRKVTDGDNDRVHGTYVTFDGGGGTAADLSTLDLYVGADDREREYVAAGESYAHGTFGNVEFHLGGLSPDMADASDGLTVAAAGEDTATVTFTGSGGDEATVEFVHTPDGGSTFDLADSDGDGMVVIEGHPVAEDEYVPTDAGGFTHLWEVTGVLGETSGISADDEATIDLQDAVTGDSVEVTLDAVDEDATFSTSGNEYFAGTKVIDGQTYRFVMEGSATFGDGDGDQEFKVVWGTDASVPMSNGEAIGSVETGGESGNSGATTAYSSLELDSGARLAFYDPSQTASGLAFGTPLDDFNTNEFFVNASAQSTEDANGYGDGDPIARVINDHDGVFDIASGDGIDAFGANARYLDGGDGTYNAGDEVYIDDDQDTVYTAQADTVFDGSAPSAGTGLVTSAISAWVQVGVIDSSDGDAWDAGADTIFYDSDNNDAYNGSAGDTVLAGNTPADGTAQTGEGGKDADWSTVNLYDDASGDAYDSNVDAILRDFHAGATYSAAQDSHVNAGTDGTFDATDGQALLDLNETKFFAVDVDASGGISTGDEVAFAIEGDLTGGDTVSVFPTTTRHTGSQPYNASETVVSDEDDSGDYTSGDIVFGGSSATVQRYSTDPTETDGLSSAAQTMINGLSGPAAVVIEPTDDADVQEAHAATASWSTDEIELDTPQFPDPAKFAATSLESDSDVTVGYTRYGSYTRYDSDGQGTFDLYVPDGQAAAGAAFTTPGGSLDTGGTTATSYTAFEGRTSLPNMARLDTEVTSSVRSSNHLILVGGPAVNQLVADLAAQGDTWTQQEWFQHEDEALVQVVENAFTDGQHAMVVAGYAADDTRAAARYIAEYGTHEQALADAGNQLTLTEADYPAER